MKTEAVLRKRQTVNTSCVFSPRLTSGFTTPHCLLYAKQEAGEREPGKKVQECLLWPKEISKMESLEPTYQPPWGSYRLPSRLRSPAGSSSQLSTLNSTPLQYWECQLGGVLHVDLIYAQPGESTQRPPGLQCWGALGKFIILVPGLIH